MSTIRQPEGEWDNSTQIPQNPMTNSQLAPPDCSGWSFLVIEPQPDDLLISDDQILAALRIARHCALNEQCSCEGSVTDAARKICASCEARRLMAGLTGEVFLFSGRRRQISG